MIITINIIIVRQLRRCEFVLPRRFMDGGPLNGKCCWFAGLLVAAFAGGAVVITGGKLDSSILH
jgi:hypothetical protein